MDDRIQITGGPGDSPENAWVITGAENNAEGVFLEYALLERLFGTMGEDWDVEIQAVVEASGRQFDEMILRLSNGEKCTVYIDVSDFIDKVPPAPHRRPGPFFRTWQIILAPILLVFGIPLVWLPWSVTPETLGGHGAKIFMVGIGTLVIFGLLIIGLTIDLCTYLSWRFRSGGAA